MTDSATSVSPQSMRHMIKNIAKTRFLFGLAHLMAETKQSTSNVTVQDRLSDFVLWLDACRRLVAHYRAQGSRVVLVANVIWA